jgi:hypothetical protein
MQINPFIGNDWGRQIPNTPEYFDYYAVDCRIYVLHHSASSIVSPSPLLS